MSYIATPPLSNHAHFLQLGLRALKTLKHLNLRRVVCTDVDVWIIIQTFVPEHINASFIIYLPPLKG